MIRHDYASPVRTNCALRKRTIINAYRLATEGVMAILLAVVPYALLYFVEVL